MERRYKEILNNTVERTFDVAETADLLLRYLGKDAITDTRYYWDPNRTRFNGCTSIMIAPRMLRPLVHALFIELHNYPNDTFVKRRYETQFVSLEETFKRMEDTGEG